MKTHSALYTVYMKSQAWRDLRAKILDLDSHSCQKCGGSDGLEVHHKTYIRLGNEDVNDLITLCHACHERRHGTKKRKKK